MRDEGERGVEADILTVSLSRQYLSWPEWHEDAGHSVTWGRGIWGRGSSGGAMRQELTWKASVAEAEWAGGAWKKTGWERWAAGLEVM